MWSGFLTNSNIYIYISKWLESGVCTPYLFLGYVRSVRPIARCGPSTRPSLDFPLAAWWFHRVSPWTQLEMQRTWQCQAPHPIPDIILGFKYHICIYIYIYVYSYVYIYIYMYYYVYIYIHITKINLTLTSVVFMLRPVSTTPAPYGVSFHEFQQINHLSPWIYSIFGCASHFQLGFSQHMFRIYLGFPYMPWS